MIRHAPVLGQLILLVERTPEPPPARPHRGRPVVYSDRLFLKALLIMIVRYLHRVHELLAVLGEPPMQPTVRCRVRRLSLFVL